MKEGTFTNRTDIENPLVTSLPPPKRQFAANLPEELIVHILSFLDPASIATTRLVEKALNEIAHDPLLWKKYSVFFKYALPDLQKENPPLPLVINTIKKLHSIKVTVRGKVNEFQDPYTVSLPSFPLHVFTATLFGDVAFIQSYVDTLPINFKTIHQIYSLCALAVAHGHFDAMSLVPQEAVTDEFVHHFALCISASFGNNQIMHTLLEKIEKLYHKGAGVISVAFLNAVKQGHLEAAKQLSEYVTRNFQTKNDFYEDAVPEALHRAMVRSDKIFTAYLVDLIEKNKLSPLHSKENIPEGDEPYKRKYSCIQVLSSFIHSENFPGFQGYLDLVFPYASEALLNRIAAVIVEKGSDTMLSHLLSSYHEMKQADKLPGNAAHSIIEAGFIAAAHARRLDRVKIFHDLFVSLESYEEMDSVYCAIAGRTGTFETLQWLETQYDFTARNVVQLAFMRAASAGNLDYMQWLVDQKRIIIPDTAEDSIYKCLIVGQLNTIEWIRAHFDIEIDLNVAFTVVTNNLNINGVKWLASHFKTQAKDWTEILVNATNQRNVEILEFIAPYCADMSNTTAETVLSIAGTFMSKKVLACFYEKYSFSKETIENAFIQAATEEHFNVFNVVDFLQYLDTHYTLSSKIKSQLANKLRQQKMNGVVLEWLEENIATTEPEVNHDYLPSHSVTPSPTQALPQTTENGPPPSKKRRLL